LLKGYENFQAKYRFVFSSLSVKKKIFNLTVYNQTKMQFIFFKSCYKGAYAAALIVTKILFDNQ